MGRRALFALAVLLALLAQPALALWTQELTVAVVDQAGQPVRNADVAVLYQMDSPGPVPDGFVQSSTDLEGVFFAHLFNTVPPENENRTYSVRVETYYWGGMAIQARADNPGQKRIRVEIPFVQESVAVRASPAGSLFPGAYAEMYGSPLIEQFDGNGVAEFIVPRGLQFSGYVVSGSLRKLFFSESATLDKDGRRTIDVLLPSDWEEADGEIPIGAGPIDLAISFVRHDGSPFAGESVAYSYGEVSKKTTTDQNGVAVLEALSGIPVSISLVAENYPRTFTYMANESGSRTMAIPGLLALQPPLATPEGGNCYRVTANATDPRKELGLAVEFVLVGALGNKTLPAETDASGLPYATACVESDSTMLVRAHNQYESAESSVRLEYSAPARAPAQPAEPGILPGIGKPPESLLPWALVAAMLAAIAGILLFAKRRLGASLRFTLDYLRAIWRSTGRQTPSPAVQEPALAGPPKGILSKLLSVLFPARKEKPGEEPQQPPPVQGGTPPA